MSERRSDAGRRAGSRVLQLCDEDELDLQVAVRQLEWISSELKRLDPAERDALIAFVHREAEATSDLDYRAFLLKFPEALGLLNE